MENRKELTNELIAESLKELTMSVPFEKITIRMITERAGVIRPTFYYHFQDKYETLEWIVRNQLLKDVGALFDDGRFDDSIRLVFERISAEMDFYRRAFMISGQNSFRDIFTDEVYRLLKTRLGEKIRQYEKDIPLLSNDMVARYYAVNIVSFAEGWLFGQQSGASARDMADAYIYLLRHSYPNLFGKNDRYGRKEQVQPK